MKAVIKIPHPDWLPLSELTKIFDVLGTDTVRLVGGCVRNAIIEGQETDIDLATTLTPEKVVQKCKEAQLKTVPIGIDHGTVMVVVNEIPFEVTTLRRDVETDGRHATVAFSDGWPKGIIEDACRRDFTMNALYMDLEGNVFDPLGSGIEDLKTRLVIFVGEPAKRIAEDYLRILRFFRFHAQYGAGDIDAEGLKACVDAGDQIETLSRERITQEFLKILSTDRSPDILKIMFDHGVLDDMPNENYDGDILSRLIDFQNEQGVQNNMSRLFVLGGNKPNLFEKYLRLSHAQMKFLIKLEMATNPEFYADEKAIKKAIFYHGNELLVQGYLLGCAIRGNHANETLFDVLKNWQAQTCPITGETLLAEGFQTGPELGIELKRRTEEWLEESI